VSPHLPLEQVEASTPFHIKALSSKIYSLHFSSVSSQPEYPSLHSIRISLLSALKFWNRAFRI